MAKKKIETTIKIVRRDNKSRRGLYIQIKQKGNKVGLYKLTGEHGQIDATKQYYEDKYVKGKKIKGSYVQYKKAYEEKIEGTKVKKRTRVHRQAEQYISKIRRQGTIKSKLKKGVSEGTIYNILTAKTENLTNTKKKIISNLVIDKGLTRILITDENFNKLKNRLDYEVKAKDKNGKTLIEANKHGKTINEIKNDIKEVGKDKIVKKRDYDSISEKLKKKGWEATTKDEGRIVRWKLKITLRRG